MCKRLSVLEAVLARLPSDGLPLPPFRRPELPREDALLLIPVTPSEIPGPAGDILFPFMAPTSSRDAYTYTYADDREILIFAAQQPGRKP